MTRMGKKFNVFGKRNSGGSASSMCFGLTLAVLLLVARTDTKRSLTINVVQLWQTEVHLPSTVKLMAYFGGP